METPQQPSRSWQRGLAAAARFWEPRRIVYNLILAAICVIWLVATWPHFRVAFRLAPFLQLSVLGLLANVCYCAAYIVDLPLRSSALGAIWSRRCWTLWVLGTAFAILLENYWIADEIYPFVSR